MNTIKIYTYTSSQTCRPKGRHDDNRPPTAPLYPTRGPWLKPTLPAVAVPAVFVAGPGMAFHGDITVSTPWRSRVLLVVVVW